MRQLAIDHQPAERTIGITSQTHAQAVELRARLNAGAKPEGYPMTVKTKSKASKPRDVSLAAAVGITTAVVLDMLDDGRLTRAELLRYVRMLRDLDPMAADERDWQRLQRKITGPKKRP